VPAFSHVNDFLLVELDVPDDRCRFSEASLYDSGRDSAPAARDPSRYFRHWRHFRPVARRDGKPITLPRVGKPASSMIGNVFFQRAKDANVERLEDARSVSRQRYCSNVEPFQLSLGLL